MLNIMFKLLWVTIYSIAVSATPALLIRLPGDNMMILMTWKIQITLMVFVFLSVIELIRLKDYDKNFLPITMRKCVYIFIAGFMYIFWLLGLLEA